LNCHHNTQEHQNEGYRGQDQPPNDLLHISRVTFLNLDIERRLG